MKMWDDDDTLGCFIVCMLVLAFIACALFFYGKGHRFGQIDALTGNETIELRDMPDSTREWVEKEQAE